ncbi:MAG: heme NO-binding domain-containing protein [Brevinematales bacterium]|nr:heme NO-binding domain-containing protein [Brevinematales bacterium]
MQSNFVIIAIKEWILKNYGLECWKEIEDFLGLDTSKYREWDETSYRALRRQLLSQIKETDDFFNSEFTNFWLTEFIPKLINNITNRCSNTKNLLLSIITINNEICKIVRNSLLNQIDFSVNSDDSITIYYTNEKALVDIVGILRGAKIFLQDDYEIKKLGPQSSKIIFFSTYYK